MIRAVWGCMRTMNWWIETLMSHFQSDVIEPALRRVLERIEVGELSGSTVEGGVRGIEGMSAGATGHARWKSTASKSSRPSTPVSTLHPSTPSSAHLIPPLPSPPAADPPLDFASLTTIHSLYLSTLYSGLLLDSEELSEQVREMLGTCDEFAARLGRWGGDILPGLLDSSTDERNAQSTSPLRIGRAAR